MVHINHGIGIFSKIERMTAGGVERDFLLIEYADGDKLYVSLDQITMVQKYIGIEGRKPRIDALGKKSAWNRIKEKVKKSVEEMARGAHQDLLGATRAQGLPVPAGHPLAGGVRVAVRVRGDARTRSPPSRT